MPYKLYDYLDANGVNEFEQWTRHQEKDQRTKLRQKLDSLAALGDELMPQLLTGTHVPGILKLRTRGNIQLRPLLCKGPHSIAEEYTLLMGAREVGDKWDPSGAPDTANSRKAEVLANGEKRRTPHVIVTEKKNE
jgi:hypothetical protein